MKAIFTKYHGQTNSKPARISAADSDGNRVVVSRHSFDSAEDAHHGAAIALCRKMRWYGTLAHGGYKKGNVYVWADGRDLIRVEQEAGSCDK